MEEYFATCLWMNYIYGWQCGWQMKMDELFHECWQQKNNCEKLNKRMEKIMLISCEKLDTWNVEVKLQIIFYINLTWNILSSATSKPYRMLN
jgi:hypothetical protein